MRAITYAEYGGPEVLRVGEMPTPEPTGAQVRVKVRAAGVNPIDWKIRSAAMPSGPDVTFPRVPGIEVAGVIDAVGPDVSGMSVGDEVFGWSTSGGHAEYAVGTDLMTKPPGLDFAEAVGISVASETALRTLALLDLKPGETLLVHGAAGSVGAFAVQLARRAGVNVIGTAGASNQDAVRELGAVPTLYGDGLVGRVRELAPDGIDAVLDTAGQGALPASIELLGGSTERIVTIADPAAASLGVAFSSGVGTPRDTAAVAEVAASVAAGEISLPEPRVFPFEEAAAAHEASEHGHGRGKVVLQILP